MSLSPEQIKQVAHLARLEVKPSNIDAYARQLSDIMRMVDQLSAVNTEGVQEMAHPLDMSQRLRADDVSESNQRETFQAQAPAVQEGLYLVPKVLE